MPLLHVQMKIASSGAETAEIAVIEGVEVIEEKSALVEHLRAKQIRAAELAVLPLLGGSEILSHIQRDAAVLLLGVVGGILKLHSDFSTAVFRSGG